MIKNYFKIAWRNLQKSKSSSFINIGGLGRGYDRRHTDWSLDL
jgi:putative ABC transport system permease protein